MGNFVLTLRRVVGRPGAHRTRCRERRRRFPEAPARRSATGRSIWSTWIPREDAPSAGSSHFGACRAWPVAGVALLSRCVAGLRDSARTESAFAMGGSRPSVKDDRFVRIAPKDHMSRRFARLTPQNKIYNAKSLCIVVTMTEHITPKLVKLFFLMKNKKMVEIDETIN